VVLRFGDDTSGAFLLLTHTSGDTAPREIGNGFSRVAFTVPAVAPLVDRVRQAGYAVTMAPKLIPEVGVEVALVTDPDGYTVELIEFKET
jgi:Glyoxalase/Bleomycin resistance protein/Dioxygenase superfamily.